MREREREEEMSTYFHVRLGMNTAVVQQLLSYFRSVCLFELGAWKNGSLYVLFRKNTYNDPFVAALIPSFISYVVLLFV